MDTTGIYEATYRLFMTDAEFRAKAMVASDLAAEMLRHRTGGGVLQRHERKVVEHAAAIALYLELHDQREAAMALPTTCTQCGSAYKVCAFPDCGEKIIFVPRSGFGMSGEWRHIEPPDFTKVRQHIPHPVLNIT